MAVNQKSLNRNGGRGDDALASRLMQDKNKARAANESDSAEEPQTDFSQYSPLSQMGLVNRRQAATGQKDPAAASSVMAKLNKVLAGFLKTCWQNIIFYSFTTSIIWIDIHVLGTFIWPKMFCKLGHEWIPPEMQKAAPKQAEAFGDQIGSCEKGCCCCVNGFCGMIVISVLVVAATVLGFYNSTIGKVFGWLSDAWETVSGLFG